MSDTRNATATTKRRPQRGKGRSGGGVHHGLDLMSEVRNDRAHQRQEVRQAAIERALDVAISHLRRHGSKRVPFRDTTRARWSDVILETAVSLMRVYFTDAEAITAAEAALQKGIVEETRRRFATTCVVKSVRGTPGQTQEWYLEAEEKAAAFLESLKGKKPKAS